MRKVSNSNYNEIEQRYEDLSTSLSQFEDLTDQIKAQLSEWLGSFETENGKNIFDVLEEIKTLKGELEEHSNDLVSSMESYQEERSEKWHSSDAGCNYSDWLEQWRDLSNTVASPVYWFALSGDIEEAIELDAGTEEITALPSQQPDYD